MGRLVLHYFDINDLKNIDDIPYLLESDYQEAYKYRQDIDRKQHLISAYFKRKYIKDYEIDQYKKPVSKACFFNISHANNMVIFMMNKDYEIGIDVEEIKEQSADLIKYICSNLEYQYVKDAKNFAEIWTSKESLVKAYGKGLVKDIKNIPSLPLDGIKEYNENLYQTKVIHLNDYVISICLKNIKPFEIALFKETIWED